MDISYDFVVPAAKEYVKAFKKIKKNITEQQKRILEYHYRAAHHSATYLELAQAIGADEYLVAYSEYEKLGQMLGETLSMGYLESVSNPGKPFFASAIGCGNPYKSEGQDYHLVLYREVVEALSKVKWFK